MDRLEHLHCKTVENLGGKWDPGYYKDLVFRYREPHRAYHNEFHIASVIDRLYDLDPELDDTVVLAALYHDAVYVPGFSQNEPLSSGMAAYHLNGMGVSDVYIYEIQEMIKLTNRHQSGWPKAMLLIDADLYELGTNLYWDNSLAIREEFSDVPEDQYRQGRATWIESFLARDRIYLGEQSYNELEDKARDNLNTELEKLSWIR